jgi:hypothetical protein
MRTQGKHNNNIRERKFLLQIKLREMKNELLAILATMFSEAHKPSSHATWKS